MLISLYSFMMAMLWSSFFTLLLFLCRRRTKFIESFGIGGLLFLCVLCFVRLSLPIEFHFTKEVETPGLYNPVNNFLHQDVSGNITLVRLLFFICGAVSLLLLIRFAAAYIKILGSLHRIPEYRSVQIEKIMRQVIPDSHRSKIRIVPAKPNSIPKTIGIRKGFILLPVRSYKDKELRYILAHEYAHFINHDGLLKRIAELFCIIYWWFPPVYLLRTELENILEMRCDRAVTKGMKQSDVRYYLKTIVHVAIERKSKRSIFSLFLSGDNRLKQRFIVVLRYRRKKYSKTIISICAVVTILVMIVSYLFVFQPAYYDPSGIYPNQDDFTFIENINKTYSVTVGENEYTVPADYLNQNE